MVYLFVADDQSFKPEESNEMRPAWFLLQDIPYDQMWDDARYWLPGVLAGDRFKATFFFKPDNKLVYWVELIEFPDGVNL